MLYIYIYIRAGYGFLVPPKKGMVPLPLRRIDGGVLRTHQHMHCFSSKHDNAPRLLSGISRDTGTHVPFPTYT